MATNHFTDFLNLPKVALFNPEVTEKTGISSYSLIEMVVKKLKPTVIIIIDSLATNNEMYLNRHYIFDLFLLSLCVQKVEFNVCKTET